MIYLICEKFQGLSRVISNRFAHVGNTDVNRISQFMEKFCDGICKCDVIKYSGYRMGWTLIMHLYYMMAFDSRDIYRPLCQHLPNCHLRSRSHFDKWAAFATLLVGQWALLGASGRIQFKMGGNYLFGKCISCRGQPYFLPLWAYFLLTMHVPYMHMVYSSLCLHIAQ